MKKIVTHTVMFVAAAALIGATVASAQVTETVQFKTAFPFTVGNTTYPAGSFTIKPADDGDNTLLEVSNGSIATLLLVEPEQPNPNQPVKDEVVFKKYGDRYVLSDIWDQADGTGVRAQPSIAERRHAAKHGEPTRESVSTSKNPASGS